MGHQYGFVVTGDEGADIFLGLCTKCSTATGMMVRVAGARENSAEANTRIVRRIARRKRRDLVVPENSADLREILLAKRWWRSQVVVVKLVRRIRPAHHGKVIGILGNYADQASRCASTTALRVFQRRDQARRLPGAVHQVRTRAVDLPRCR